MAKQLTSKTINSLVNQSLAIEDDQAQDINALGFMARAMVQATLPHRKVNGTYFERRNGTYILSMQAHPEIGLPYGSIPRILLAWATTEAVKTRIRDLELGDNMSGFMRELGLSPTGGIKGDITRLKNQTLRLFSTSVSALHKDGNSVSEMGYRLADKTMLWWDINSPEQGNLWKSTVTLSENFFKEVIDRPVPIDMRAIKVLKQSSMALDIYTWLTYRVSYLSLPTVIPWSLLAMQFGSDYARLRDFKKAFIAELKKVVLVYRYVQVEPTEHGLIIKPSLTHICKNA